MRLTRYTDCALRAAVFRRPAGADLLDLEISRACGLTGALDEALRAYLVVLDGDTLSDLLAKRSKLVCLFDLELDLERARPAPAGRP